MIYVYSFFVLLLIPLLTFSRIFSKSLRRFFPSERKVGHILSIFQPSQKKCAVFFCSSAGEFEQARPLIDSLQDTYAIHVFFFSPSGLEFANARKEKVSYSLAPLDQVWAWNKIYDFWRPDLSIVIRHELWPAFLNVASKRSKLVLVNYSNFNPPSFLQKKLLRHFSHIMCIHKKCAATLSALGKNSHIHVTGDTKADRVFMRASASNSLSLANIYKSHKIKHLILGSAWEGDVQIIAKAMQTYTNKENWRITICPHDIGPKNMDKLTTIVQRLNYQIMTYSQLKADVTLHHNSVIIVDKLGILAELYRIASAAFVGGGMHNKVHNVLEPAAYGCPIAFGPHFQNSPEACYFVEEGCAHVMNSPSDVETWLEMVDGSDVDLRKRVQEAADALRGGTENILELLLEPYANFLLD